MRLVDKARIRAATNKAIKKAGSQKAVCEESGIDEATLSLFLNGHRNPPAFLLAYLGYGQKTVYYKLKED